jgi:hypothetical protein
MDGLPVTEHLERLNEAFVRTWWHWWLLGQTDKPGEAFISADPSRWYQTPPPEQMGEDNHVSTRTLPLVSKKPRWPAGSPSRCARRHPPYEPAIRAACPHQRFTHQQRRRQHPQAMTTAGGNEPYRHRRTSVGSGLTRFCVSWSARLTSPARRGSW